MTDQREFPRTKTVPLRIVFALLTFLYLSMYVWAAQKAYDSMDNGFLKLVLYSLIILGAGMTYDCGKILLLMPVARFNVLLKKTIIPVAQIIVVLLATGVGTVAFAAIGWPMSALIVYVSGLFVVLFGFNSRASGTDGDERTA